ncbi:MAG: DUF1499 domain-containing protein [Candidatus Binataceae bacterium]
MANDPLILAATVVVAVVLLAVRSTRRVVFGFLRVAISLAAIAVAFAGLAILLNNVTIYEPPGVAARVTRFLTVNRAATSKDGLATEECVWGDEATPAPSASPVATPAGPSPTLTPKAAAKSKGKAKPVVTTPTSTVTPSPAASPTPAAAQEQPELFAELVRHGYPGIGARQIYDEALATAKALPGWRVIAEDPKHATIDCIYTTRFLGWQDDVRIKVSGNSEVDMCSRSRVALPDSNSILGWFPGDFGANLGHIKEFYTVLDPRIDALYKAAEEREKTEPPKPKVKQPSIEEFEAAPPPVNLD